jgi:hypothetical protein
MKTNVNRDGAQIINYSNYHATPRSIIRERIAKALAVEPATLKHRGRNNAASNACKILAYTAYRQFDILISAIARVLGVGGSAVSMMLNTGAELHSRLVISLID